MAGCLKDDCRATSRDYFPAKALKRPGGAVLSSYHYGDGLYQEAERILGIDESRLMQLKSIAERFQILVRAKNLTWRHHYEVASIRKVEAFY